MVRGTTHAFCCATRLGLATVKGPFGIPGKLVIFVHITEVDDPLCFRDIITARIIMTASMTRPVMRMQRQHKQHFLLLVIFFFSFLSFHFFLSSFFWLLR